MLKAAGDQEGYVRSAAIQALGGLGAGLISQPEALALVLKAAGDQNWYVREVAIEIFKNVGLAALIPGYLATQTQRQEWFNRPENLWQPVLLPLIQQTWPVLAFDGKTLIVVSGSSSERFALSSPERIRPLIDAINKAWKGYGFPLVSFEACTGKKTRYPQLQPPDFKSAPQLALDAGNRRRATRLAPVENKKNLPELGRMNSTGHMLVDFNIPYWKIKEEKVLGEGAFGTVSLGKYDRDRVAIKRFKLEDFPRELLQKILSEASVMARIQSDYLVGLRGVCLEAPHYCLVMEYLPGGDLYQLLHPKKSEVLSPSQPLSLSQCYRLASDMAIGLSYLHQQGILHRDLKSLNVLLWREYHGEWRAKLSDFGLSTLKRSLLRGEGVVGSWPWLAPEIMMGTDTEAEDQYSKATDVYGLGMLLYELATGKVPFFDLPNKPAKPNARKSKNGS